MKKLIVLIVCFMFLGVTICFAEEGRQAEVKSRHSWELGSEISYIEYKEPDVMEEDGVMYGLTGSYTYRGWLPPSPSEFNKVMLRIEGRAAFGEVDYTSPGSGEMENIDDYILEFRVLPGYDISLSETYTVTPYLGFGWRYLNDDTSDMVTTTGARGYERESQYIYTPIGMEIVNNLKRGWSLGGILEYDHFWIGRQRSHLSDAVAGYNDLTNDQKRGSGWRGSVKIQKKGKTIDLIIEPFIRYWNIKKSEDSNLTYSGILVGYGYEPKNNSTEYGVKVAAKF